jgi:hypothetical protein
MLLRQHGHSPQLHHVVAPRKVGVPPVPLIQIVTGLDSLIRLQCNLAPRLIYETKEPQPVSASRAKLILAQGRILNVLNEIEILEADPRPAGKPEESRGIRAKIDVTEIAKGKPQWREDFVIAVLVFPAPEMLDFDGMSTAFIARRHVAQFERTETERALDFLHVTDPRGPIRSIQANGQQQWKGPAARTSYVDEVYRSRRTPG